MGAGLRSELVVHRAQGHHQRLFCRTSFARRGSRRHRVRHVAVVDGEAQLGQGGDQAREAHDIRRPQLPQQLHDLRGEGREEPSQVRLATHRRDKDIAHRAMQLQLCGAVVPHRDHVQPGAARSSGAAVPRDGGERDCGGAQPRSS